MLDREYGLLGFQYFDNDLRSRTQAFLRDRFPQGTQVSELRKFITGLGGTCKPHEGATAKVSCEYCREKVDVITDWDGEAYAVNEFLWHFDARLRDHDADQARETREIESLGLSISRYGGKRSLDFLPESLSDACADIRKESSRSPRRRRVHPVY